MSLPAAIAHKRLIFTISPGRSGTTFLKYVLDIIPDVDAYHEPYPNFFTIMRQVQTNPDLARRFWIEEKLPHIAGLAAPIYAETSHVFCKGFLEPLLALGIVPDVIVLRRDHRQVARSMLEIKSIPGTTEKGLDWNLMPDDPGVIPLPGWRDLHPYQLCFWYCLEIERRAQVYAADLRQRGARVVETDLHTLNSISEFNRVRRALDLRAPRPPKMAKFVYTTTIRLNNQRQHKRTYGVHVPPEDELAALEADLLARLAGAEKYLYAHTRS